MKTLITPVMMAGLVLSAGCSDTKTDSTASQSTQGQSPAMVAAADPRAVRAGLEVISKGGTAIDAAIAVQSVLGLVEPQSSGIAGGAFLIYLDAESGDVTMYDGRETAPAAATPKLFYGDGKRLPYIKGIASGRSTGVPGAIAMLNLAHSDHGKLEWGSNFDAAIKLGDEGFVVTPALNRSITRTAKYGLLNQQKATRDYFFQADGETPLEAGTLRLNAPYAATLRAIAQDYRSLYSGDIAQSIIDATREEPRPGGLTMADFADYKPRKRPALCSGYKEMTICGSQPPSSGGVAVQAIMRILENFDLSSHGHDTAQGWHYFIEASRLAYADRDEFVADDAFIDVPIKAMLNKEYLGSRAQLVSADKAMQTVSVGDPAGFKPGKDYTPDSPGTSHMSIVDTYGNAVAMTTTVESGFGSQRMASGMILNNQLTDFSFEPVTAQGNPIANAVAPGKRPRSSMSPTLVLDKDGEFLIATGSPGGNSIIAYTAKTLVGMLEWGLTPQQSADLPNVIARGNTVKMENAKMPEPIIKALMDMGHDISLSGGEHSGIHIIRRLPDGSLIGGADPRREGVALLLTDLGAP